MSPPPVDQIHHGKKTIDVKQNGKGFDSKSKTDVEQNSRVFQKWRVMLDQQGRLIIKGILSDCGQMARSKPVKQRISRNKVLSIYNHYYILDGTIVDNNNALPDYVRGKFYNGFPDDWENVYQLYRNFVAQGSQITFRWPTPVTDSDIDLVSEITEIPDYNYTRALTCKETTSSRNNPQKILSSGYNSKSQSDNYQNLKKSNENKILSKNIDSNNSIVKDLEQNSEEKAKENNCPEKSNNINNQQKDCSFFRITSKFKYSDFLLEILKEDKFCMIRSNLGKQDCPTEYLDKFLELVDCLLYLFPINQEKEIDNKTKSKNDVNKVNTISLTESVEVYPEKKSCDVQNVTSKSEETCKELEASKNIQLNENQSRNFENANCAKSSNINDSSSDDMTMGIIPLRFTLKGRMKNKNFRNRQKSKKNIKNDIPIKQQNKFVLNENIQNNSCISIVEEDDEIKKTKKKVQDQSNQIRETPTCKNSNTENHEYNNFHKTNTNHTVSPSISKRPNLEKRIATSIQSPSTLRKKTTEKLMIKSSTPVNINLKKSNPLKHLLSNNTKVDQEVSKKKQKLNNDQDDESSDNLLNHPFVTFIEDTDSEKELPTKAKGSFQNLNKISKDNENKKLTSSPNKKKLSTNNEVFTNIFTNKPYGTKHNPKLLNSWIPCVVYNDKRKKNVLTFKGQLLNEVGHVLHKKFVTDPVVKRHSHKLIETEKNEYFMLQNEINNSKRDMPQELQNYCRNGCPTNIDEFCQLWKKLYPVEKMVSMDCGSSNKTDSVLENKKINTTKKSIVPTMKENENFQNKIISEISNEQLRIENQSLNQSPLKSRYPIVKKIIISEDDDDDDDNLKESKKENLVVLPLKNQMNENKFVEPMYNAKLRKRKPHQTRSSKLKVSYKKNKRRSDCLSSDLSSIVG